MSKAAGTAYSEEVTYVRRRRKKKKHYNPMVKSSIFAIIVVGMVLVYLLLSSVIMIVGYEKARVEGQLLGLQNEQRLLTVEMNRLKSLARIESVARQDLNMVKPDSVKVITLSKHDDVWDNTQNYIGESSAITIAMEDNVRLKKTVYEAVLGLLSQLVMSWFGDSLAFVIY